MKAKLNDKDLNEIGRNQLTIISLKTPANHN